MKRRGHHDMNLNHQYKSDVVNLMPSSLHFLLPSKSSIPFSQSVPEA